MSLRTSATRYAKALLEVAIRESDPAQVEVDLTGIVDAMTATPELRRGMLSPAIAQTARISLAKAIIERASLQAPVAKLLMMLAERGRLELLPDLLEVYRLIEIPTLLLWADEDRLHPLHIAEEALDLLPDAQLRVLEGTGFLMAYDDPVGLARELAAFCG